MTPNDIDVVLHYYYMAEPHPRINAEAVQGAIRMFLFSGILKENNGPAKYQTTERGNTFVRMLCTTPYPEKEVRWVDPRTGKDIPE